MKAKIFFLAGLILFSLFFASTPEEDFNDCLCQCRCINAMGFSCGSGGDVCEYDPGATLCGFDRAAEDNAVCSCYSPGLCYRVAFEPSGSDCYNDCVKWYNQAKTQPKPKSVCGDSICSEDESAYSCPEDCAPKEEEKKEKCENDKDDDGDHLIDCFDTADCRCSETITITVVYEGEDGKLKPLVGATLNFTWKDKNGKEKHATAMTNEEGAASAKIEGVWGGDGIIQYSIYLVDQKFKFMENKEQLYSVSDEITLKSVLNLHKKYKMTGNDRIVARIWDRLHEVYDFYTKSLHANVDYQMPEEIYVKPDANGGASHAYDSATYKQDNGITFQNKIFNRGFMESSSPQNCEWHEFNHHAMMAIYGGMWDQKRIRNHLGWDNPQSDDSYVEGFAEFMSLLETVYYADRYPRLAEHPSIYYWDGTASNLEKNFKIQDDEELAIASILWDLYDPHRMSQIDKDHIEIDKTTLWQVLSTQHKFSDGQTRYIHNTRDLYEAVKAINDPQFSKKYKDAYEPNDDGWMDEAPALEKIFIVHGAFFDKNNNSRWDVGEEVGYTSKKGEPSTRRTDKELPPGSFIRANINNGEIKEGTVRVKVTHPDPYSYLNYEYESNFMDGLIGIAPPYDTPTIWEITVTRDGYTESQPITLTSEEYNAKYDPNKEYFDSKEFVITSITTPGYEEEDIFDGLEENPPPEEEACCLPALLCVGILTVASLSSIGTCKKGLQ
ncbi:MAG: hypothetical protein QXG02_02650 [Candidatus Anstonellales archaeon]